MSADPFQRFVDAQRDVYAQVERELLAGRKETHWMWYIFPQLKGLGTSSAAQQFAIASLDEATAYLAHRRLGRRLRACTRLVTTAPATDIAEIFGYPDHFKFHSSMTLFIHATEDKEVFREALDKFFDGKFDSKTTKYLTTSRPGG